MTRVVLLGLGFWGRTWLEALRTSPECDLVAVAAGAASLDACGIGGATGPRPYTDFAAAITSEQADAAIIVLPTGLHVEAGLRALEAGLHVLSEKPLAPDLAGASTLREAARRRPDLVYMVNQNYRWRAHNRTLHQAIAMGRIGQPAAAHLTFRQPEFLAGERRNLEMPLIQDMSIHHFDLLRYLLGVDAVEVWARSYRPPWSRYPGLPSTEAVIEMDGGLIVGYSGTWAARGRPTLWDGEISVTGPRGCLTLDRDGHVRLYEDTVTSPDEFTGFEAGGDGGRVLAPMSAEPDEQQATFRAFIDAISTGAQPSTCLEDNFRSFAMVAAAEESARTGRPVPVAR